MLGRGGKQWQMRYGGGVTGGSHFAEGADSGGHGERMIVNIREARPAGTGARS